jgi:hypothetical protein
MVLRGLLVASLMCGPSFCHARLGALPVEGEGSILVGTNFVRRANKTPSPSTGKGRGGGEG